MPASILTDMNSHNGGGLEPYEDNRVLQIALELSKLPAGLNDNDDLSQAAAFERERAFRKSANMTERVPVPSSEHVAEIVGRQGCKIKALRAKTNTYIKTPVRGEEPIFLVTGRQEDVILAKQEILSAADHFSQIRASRRNNAAGGGTAGPAGPAPPSPSTPGQVTLPVPVPYRVVGLVVGPKGATIKRIQQETHTYIVTPSRDKDPIFEVTGLPDNVEKAKQQIKSHIAMRTGEMADPNGHHVSPGSINLLSNGSLDEHNDFHSNGIDSGFESTTSDLIGSIYKSSSHRSDSRSSMQYTSCNNTNSTLNNSNNILSRHSQDTNIFTFPTAKMGEFTGLANGFTANGFQFYDADEGIGSPTFDAGSTLSVPATAPTSNIWSTLTDTHTTDGMSLFTANSTSVSDVLTQAVRQGSGSINHNNSSTSAVLCISPGVATNNVQQTTAISSDHNGVRRIHSDPLSNGSLSFLPLASSNFNVNATSNASLSSSTSTSPTNSTGSLGRRRSCLICTENDIVAAFIPCGHNHFCMECANRILSRPDEGRACPVCQQTVSQAIRIFSN